MSMQYLSFCDWLVALSMSSSSIHVVAGVSVSLLLKAQ